MFFIRGHQKWMFQYKSRNIDMNVQLYNKYFNVPKISISISRSKYLVTDVWVNMYVRTRNRYHLKFTLRMNTDSTRNKSFRPIYCFIFFIVWRYEKETLSRLTIFMKDEMRFVTFCDIRLRVSLFRIFSATILSFSFIANAKRDERRSRYASINTFWILNILLRTAWTTTVWI